MFVRNDKFDATNWITICAFIAEAKETVVSEEVYRATSDAADHAPLAAQAINGLANPAPSGVIVLTHGSYTIGILTTIIFGGTTQITGRELGLVLARRGPRNIQQQRNRSKIQIIRPGYRNYG